MKTLLRSLLCLALFLIVARLRGTEAEPPAAPLPPQAIADFEWFSALGFPDVRGCPLVRVATGASIQPMGQPPENTYRDAFLLRQTDGGRFTVLTTKLETRDFAATAPGTPEHLRVGYTEEQSLADATDDSPAALARDPPKSGSILHRREGRASEQLPANTQTFVWAWACWRNGLEDRAARLYSDAAIPHYGPAPGNKTLTLRDVLEAELAYTMIWRATLDFEKPEVPRARLLEAFERIARNYPASRYADSARTTAGLLRTMVAEDAAHPALSGAALASLPPEERAAELVFRLRDQRGWQLGEPGSCSVLIGGRDVVRDAKGPSPAEQLFKLGDTAVPPLLAALDDKRFSRAVGCSRSFAFSHEVLTVGECAQQILCNIAGRTFDRVAFKEQAEAWWGERHVKGEKQQLVELISRGDDRPKDKAQVHLYELAERLRRRYPDAALAAIQQGVSRTRNNQDVKTLVHVASELPGHGPEAFLEMEMRQGYSLGIRVAAAAGLKRHGRGADAAAAMIHEWTAQLSEPILPHEEQDTFSPDDKSDLIRFLADCRRVDAIAALGRGLRRGSLKTRETVVSAMRPYPWPAKPPANGPDPALSQRDTDDEAKVQAAIEMLLAAELEDTEQIRGVSVTGGDGRGIEEPRLCDEAASALSKRFKDKYTFDFYGSPQERERQRIACLNVWRAAHGEPPLPPP